MTKKWTKNIVGSASRDVSPICFKKVGGFIFLWITFRANPIIGNYFSRSVTSDMFQGVLTVTIHSFFKMRPKILEWVVEKIVKNIRNRLKWAQIGALGLGIIPIGSKNQIKLVVISDWARNNDLGMKKAEQILNVLKKT